MNLNKEILKYAVPHQCSQCAMDHSCSSPCFGVPNPQCKEFIPNNMDDFLNDTIEYFEKDMIKSTDKKLKRVCNRHGHGITNKVTTLDEYYISFINDCIAELHKGKMAYIFKLSQLLEILQFIDGVRAEYQGDGIIGLICKTAKSKSKNNKNNKKG